LIVNRVDDVPADLPAHPPVQQRQQEKEPDAIVEHRFDGNGMDRVGANFLASMNGIGIGIGIGIDDVHRQLGDAERAHLLHEPKIDEHLIDVSADLAAQRPQPYLVSKVPLLCHVLPCLVCILQP
jgi:hypothetical protein